MENNIKPLPVEHPYCSICLNFIWNEVKRIYWKDVKAEQGRPISAYNRYIPVGICSKTGKAVSAFATCDSWQDEA